VEIWYTERSNNSSISERRCRFLPDLGDWVGGQGKKAKDRSSVGCKVPSSKASGDKLCSRLRPIV